jgi:2-polyprenyl-3-methyl-5-hydroxy-6-metoxy-1,4-benzoquinol methylase
MHHPAPAVVSRALASGGGSAEAIHAMVRRALLSRDLRPGVLVDVGCGKGALAAALAGLHRKYVGADVVRHEGFPAGEEFVTVDLDRGRVDLPDGAGDVVACVETIEHVENPRALVRELTRLTKPGGWLFVTTPNQLSAAAKLSLLTRNQYPAFVEAPGLYPAHITALLEADLVRLARECGLGRISIEYSGVGRVPLSALHWPRFLSRSVGALGRALSDNVMLCGQRPPAGGDGA